MIKQEELFGYEETGFNLISETQADNERIMNEQAAEAIRRDAFEASHQDLFTSWVDE